MNKNAKWISHPTAKDEAVYLRKTFNIEKNFHKTIVNICGVGMYELYINGKAVGEKLFPPYRFDVSGFLKDGKNKMTVIVSNHNGYAVRDRFSKYLMFEPSGILGPVKIYK